MQKIEEKSSRYSLIYVALIATLFSSFTLWLVESPIKYALFVFETILIIVLYVILRNYDLNFNTSHFLKSKIPFGIIWDISLIFLGLVLIILNFFQIESLLQLPLAIVSSFIAGFALLNIFKLRKYFTKLETIVLSFFTGFIFASISTLVLLWVDENTRIIIIPTVFVILGIISAFRHLKKKNGDTLHLNSLSKKIDILAIAVSMAFYVLFFYFIYPEFGISPGTDISRHLSNGIILSRTPDLYTGFSYILFHSFDSTMNTIASAPSIEYFQNVKVFLNLFLPLTVYVLAKRFFVKIDKRIPAIATIFYSVFSNFSFLYYMQLKLQETDYTVLEMLGRHVAQKAYFGTYYFTQSFAWFVPQSLGFMIFIFLILLLGIREIPRSLMIPLMSVLLISLSLIHLPQALIFVIFISFFSLMSISKTLRLNDCLISIMIAFSGLILSVLYINFFWDSMLRSVPFDPLIINYSSALLAIAGFSFFWRKKILFRLHFLERIKLTKKPYRFLSITLVSFYLIALLTWFLVDFNASTYHFVGVVPWFVYPLLLGIIGLLSIVSIRYLDQILPNSLVFLILMIIPIMVILGQVISFVNVNLFATHFWEKRLLMYIFLSASLLAPISLVKFMDRFGLRKKLFSIVTSSVIISVIVISGFSSMTLQSEFWLLASNRYAVESDEFSAVNFLKDITKDEPFAYAISPSSKSNSILTLSTIPYYLRNPQTTNLAENPDMPLFTFRSHNLPHAYLYMHERDVDLINNTKSWIYDHFIPLLPIIFESESVTIYNVSRVSYPLSKSDTTLIIPTDSRINYNNSWLFAYDMISQNEINYTVRYDSDHNALNSKKILLSYDPPLGNYPTAFIDDFSSQNNWKIIKGDWNYINNSLHGKFDSESRWNFFMSPIETKYATINTAFKIISADPKVANYVSIIYSWEDSNNYSAARASFYKDKVYVAFDTVKEGNLKIYPEWPGFPIPTSTLGWNPGDSFNMTLSKQGKNEEIFLDGTKYLTQEESVSRLGKIGLSVDRINEVSFDHFSVQQMNKLNQRNFTDYISYVDSGGHLIVLNTNGYGQFYNQFLNSNDSPTRISQNLIELESNMIENEKNMKQEATKAFEQAQKAIVGESDFDTTLTEIKEKSDPGTINVTETIDDTETKKDTETREEIFADDVKVFDINSFLNTLPKNIQTEIVENNAIWIGEKATGKGKITFLNVFPLISNYHDDKIEGYVVYNILGKLLNFVELNKIDSKPLTSKNIQLLFKNLEGTGKVRITTTSLLLPDDLRLTKVMLKNSGKNVNIKNVTGFSLEDYNNVVLRSSKISLAKGSGLYSKIILDNSINLLFSKNATVTVTSIDDTSLHFENVSRISITNEQPIEVIVRQPNIQINGNTTLYKPISSKLYSIISENAQSLNVLGEVKLSMFMSDTFNFARTIDVKGQTERSPPMIDKDFNLSPPLNISENMNISPILIPFLLIPFLIAAVLLGFTPKIK